MLKLVRERRDEGLIEFRDHAKRSKRVVALDPSLQNELLSILAERNALLLSAMAAPPPALSDVTLKSPHATE